MASADAKRQEERVKLFASALSTLGVAVIVAGFIGPSFLGQFQATIALLALLTGFGLHLVAQAVLHYVVEDAEPIGAPQTERDP